MKDRLKPRDIPAWVHGLWLSWADLCRMGGVEAMQQLVSDISENSQGTGGRNPDSCGPVLRAILAAEHAEYGEAVLVNSLYRCLPQQERHAIHYRYVERRGWEEIPGMTGPTAWRKGVSASNRLRDWVLGLRLIKGDDLACGEAVERGNRRRLDAACNG